MTDMRRYQQGTLEEVSTAAGVCWFIRFTQPDGKRPRHRVGLKKDLPTKAKASRAAQYLRDQFNAAPEAVLALSRTFDQVIDRYEAEEMPERYSTARGYRNIHRVHIRPRWGNMLLTEITPMAVRSWINGMDCATRTKGHIHGQMRVLFRFAMLWGWLPAQANPMSLFSIQGSTKRAKAPEVIGPAKFRELLDATADSKRRAMLMGAFCLGLRSSELFGLMWGDFDWLGQQLWIRRAVVRGRTGDVKTERSSAPLPLAKEVVEAFLAWRSQSPDTSANAWVFASKLQAGRAPMSSHRLQQRWLDPAGKALMGETFRLGWHTFRHSYKSMLDRVTSDATVKRDLMRHADIQTTMQVYGQVEMDRMRSANQAAIELIFRSDAH